MTVFIFSVLSLGSMRQSPARSRKHPSKAVVVMRRSPGDRGWIADAMSFTRRRQSPFGYLLPVLVSLGAIVTGFTATPEAGSPSTEYQDWIARHARKEMTSRIGREPDEPLRLAIFTIDREGEDSAPTKSHISNEATFYREVTVAGDIRGETLHGLMGNTEVGGGSPLPESRLSRLDTLQSTLPDDGERLPPASRRVLIQSAQGGRTTLRVYDRGNLPASVLELVRLARCQFEVYVPEFKAQGEIDSHQYSGGGFLRLSPDGKQLLFAGNHRLQFWQATTHEPLREVPILEGARRTTH